MLEKCLEYYFFSVKVSTCSSNNYWCLNYSKNCLMDHPKFVLFSLFYPVNIVFLEFIIFWHVANKVNPFQEELESLPDLFSYLSVTVVCLCASMPVLYLLKLKNGKWEHIAFWIFKSISNLHSVDTESVSYSLYYSTLQNMVPNSL